MEAFTAAAPEPGLAPGASELPASLLTAQVVVVTGHLSEMLAAALPELGFAGAGAGARTAPSQLSSKEAVGAAAAIERLSRVVEVAQVMLAGRVQEDVGRPLGELPTAQHYGCGSVIELLQRVTRAPARVLSKRLRIAGTLTPRVGMAGEALPAEAPAVAAAVTSGVLSFEAATLITRTLEKSRACAGPEALEIAERELVASAVGGPDQLPEHTDNLRVMCQVWESFLHPDGEEPVETVPEGLRGLRLSRERHGLVRISGALLPEVAASLGRLLDALNAPAVQRRGVRFVAPEELGLNGGRDSGGLGCTGAFGADGAAGGVDVRIDSAGGVGDAAELAAACPELSESRTPDQKRHDAFASVLSVAMQQPEIPQLGGAPVTVLLHAELNDSELSGVARNGVGRNDVGLKAAELNDVELGAVKRGNSVGWVQGFDGLPAPVPLGSIRRASCSGATQKIITDQRRRIIEIGSAQRIFNAHQRHAITLRDAGCVIPGCMTPATWCEIHHVHEHAAGGPTHVDNGVLLCWYHHRSLDTSGWQIRMNGGVPEVRPPGWLDHRRRWYRATSPLRPPGLRKTG